MTALIIILIATNLLWALVHYSCLQLLSEKDRVGIDERRELLNRVQAPQAAPYFPLEKVDVPEVPFDDDEAYWEAKK